MKNFFKMLPCALTAVAMLSCNKNEPQFIKPESESYSSLCLSVDTGITMSKASSIESKDYETAVNDVQMLIFDSDGKLAAYLSNGTELNATFKLRAGKYSAAAAVNAPALNTVNSLEELRAINLTLKDNYSKTSDMLMYGECAPVSLEKNGNASITLEVSRLVSRLRLASVANACPEGLGALKLKNVFLSNIVCNYRFGGASPETAYSNCYGRSVIGDQNSIIDGTLFRAEPEELSFASLADAAIAFNASSPFDIALYAYPNASADDFVGFSSSWTPTAMRLVLRAELDGKDYFYPVALPANKANTSYDISITVKGKGLEDPQGDISELRDKGEVSVAITVLDWISGETYALEY